MKELIDFIEWEVDKWSVKETVLGLIMVSLTILCRNLDRISISQNSLFQKAITWNNLK